MATPTVSFVTASCANMNISAEYLFEDQRDYQPRPEAHLSKGCQIKPDRSSGLENSAKLVRKAGVLAVTSLRTKAVALRTKIGTVGLLV